MDLGYTVGHPSCMMVFGQRDDNGINHYDLVYRNRIIGDATGIGTILYIVRIF